MKKAVLVLMAVALVSSFAIAQEGAKDASKSDETVVGKILSVTVADPAKGIATSAVSIVDETGKGFNFSIGQGTEIVDKTLNAITLNQLKLGEKVSVKSSNTTAGTKEAAKIKVEE